MPKNRSQLMCQKARMARVLSQSSKEFFPKLSRFPSPANTSQSHKRHKVQQLIKKTKVNRKKDEKSWGTYAIIR